MDCWLVLVKNIPSQEWFVMRIYDNEAEAALVARSIGGIVVRGSDYRNREGR